MSEYIDRQAAYEAIRCALNRMPFAQVWRDATYEDGFNDGYYEGYYEGWKEGQEALRREMWERERE